MVYKEGVSSKAGLVLVYYLHPLQTSEKYTFPIIWQGTYLIKYTTRGLLQRLPYQEGGILLVILRDRTLFDEICAQPVMSQMAK